jgi:hypothetical protein
MAPREIGMSIRGFPEGARAPRGSQPLRASRPYWLQPRSRASISAASVIWGGTSYCNDPFDTNIISKIRKGGNCDPRVTTWNDSIGDESLLSACWYSAKSAKALNGRAQQIPAKLALSRSGFLP